MVDKLVHEVDEYDAEAEASPGGTWGAFGTPARILTLGSGVLLLFLITGTIAWLLGSQSAKTDSPAQLGQGEGNGLKVAAKVGYLAPDFTLADAGSGERVRLTSLRGKPVWINYWASWCQPCVKEMPYMKSAYTKYKEKGLVILGINDDESREQINSFTRSNGYDWTFLLDPDSNMLDLYLVDAIPMHWFVGKDGVLKNIQFGGIDEAEIETYLGKIID